MSIKMNKNNHNYKLIFFFFFFFFFFWQFLNYLIGQLPQPLAVIGRVAHVSQPVSQFRQQRHRRRTPHAERRTPAAARRVHRVHRLRIGRQQRREPRAQRLCRTVPFRSLVELYTIEIKLEKVKRLEWEHFPIQTHAPTNTNFTTNKQRRKIVLSYKNRRINHTGSGAASLAAPSCPRCRVRTRHSCSRRTASLTRSGSTVVV